jgi:hypothetical protein
MCLSYWNLKATLLCQVCGKKGTWRLQTHFMGYPGSYEHEYALGETIPELQGVSVLLDGRMAAFSGDCPNCEALFEVGAEIIDGKVRRLFFLRQVKVAATIIKHLNT